MTRTSGQTAYSVASLAQELGVSDQAKSLRDRQAGIAGRHDARLTLTRYGHVIDELEDQLRIKAEEAIADARLNAPTGGSTDLEDFGS